MADDFANFVIQVDSTGVVAATKAVDDLAASVAKVDAVAKTSGSGGMKNFGFAINSLAQGLEDLQYSVGGAMNNLSNMAMFMGAGGIWVAAITAAGVAANQLYRNWDVLFGQNVPDYKGNVDDLKKSMDETAKSIENLNRLRGQQTTAEAESGRMVKEFLGVTQENRDLMEQVRREAIEASVGLSPEVQGFRRDLAEAQRGGEAARRQIARFGDPFGDLARQAQQADRRAIEAQEQLRRVEAEARKAGERDIAKLVETATTGVGPAQAGAQQMLAGMFAGRGRVGREIADVIRQNAAANQDALRLEAEAEEEAAAGGFGGKAAAANLRRRRRDMKKQADEDERIDEQIDREQERAREDLVREQASLMGPRFGQGIQAGLLGGADPRQMATQIAAQLGGGDVARGAAQQIVEQQMADMVRQFQGLLGQGFNPQQAMVTMMRDMQQAILQAQGQMFQFGNNVRMLNMGAMQINRNARTLLMWGRP